MNLKQKLIFVIFLVSLLPIIMLGYSSYRLGLNNVLRIQKQNFYRSVEREADTVKRNLEGVEREINYISNLLENDFERGLEYMASLQESSRFFKSIYVATSDKNIELFPKEELPSGFDPTQRPWYILGINSNGIAVTEPYIDVVSNTHVVGIVKKIRTKNGLEGVLSFDLNINEFVGDLQKVKLGDTGYIYITDINGLTLVHPKKDLIGQNAFSLVPDLARVLEGKSGEINYEFNGEKKLIAYKHIESLNWVISGGADISEFIRSFDRVRNAIIIILSLVILLSIIVTSLTQKKLFFLYYHLLKILKKEQMEI